MEASVRLIRLLAKSCCRKLPNASTLALASFLNPKPKTIESSDSRPDVSSPEALQGDG